MTDFERAVAKLLEQHISPPPSTTALRRRWRRRQVTHRLAVSVAVAALAAAVSVFLVGGGSGTSKERVLVGRGPASHIAPLADVAATPAGWSPVQFGSIEVSVPSSWLIEVPAFSCGDGSDGEVFIRRELTPPAHTGCATVRVANVVTLAVASRQVLRAPTAVVVNGIAATRGTTGDGRGLSVVERALGMQVTARGPLARRVLRTLTYSPLSVVLDSSIASVPEGWRSVSFGGLRFEVPGSWKVKREDGWPGCPYNLEPNYLLVQTANRLDDPSCMFPPSRAADDAGRPGLVVTAGHLLTAAPNAATCRHRGALRICVDPAPAASGGYEPGHGLGILTAQISVPGQTLPDQIEVGLSGTGLQALQMFDSIEPADSASISVLTSPPATEPATTVPESAARSCTEALVGISLAKVYPTNSGESSLYVRFANRSPHPCVLEGFPAVTVAGTKPGTVDVLYGGNPTMHSPPPRRDLLPPGQSVFAGIGWYSKPVVSGACTTIDGFRVSLRGAPSSSPIIIPPSTVCGARLAHPRPYVAVSVMLPNGKFPDASP